MNRMMMTVAFSILATGAFAWPHHGCGGWGPPPPPPHHWHHGYGGWGRGGCNFWPGFVGGVLGGVVANSVYRPTTTVVTQPVVVQQPVVVSQPVVTQPVIVQQPTVVAAPVTQVQNVWVEGRYIDQVQANGTVVRTWSPGHYESRGVQIR